jgi:hypothetical protein
MSTLETHCKWLLWTYPTAYREQRGDEILSTLLEATDPEQTWPSVGDTVDLVGHALRLRLGVGEHQPLGRLFVIVGPCQLVMAALMSVVALVFGEWSPFSPWPWVPAGHLGPFFTGGPIAYFTWILAGLSLLVDRPRLTRRLVGLSIVLTAALVPIGHLFALGRPAMSYLVFLVVLGIPYFVIPNQGLVWRATGWQRKALLAAPFLPAALISLEAARLRGVGLDPGGSYYRAPGIFFYRFALGAVAPWITWIVVAAIVVAMIAVLVGRRLLGATIALLCLPWMTLWMGNRFNYYVEPRVEMAGFLLTGVLLLILAKFAVTVRRSALEQAN